MPNAPSANYNQLISVVTVIVSNLAAISLAKGWITASTASQINNNVATIGSIIIVLVMNAALVIGNQMHRLRYGPVPALSSDVQPSANFAVFAGATSPSYGPPSSGPADEPVDVPSEVI